MNDFMNLPWFTQLVGGREMFRKERHGFDSRRTRQIRSRSRKSDRQAEATLGRRRRSTQPRSVVRRLVAAVARSDAAGQSRRRMRRHRFKVRLAADISVLLSCFRGFHTLPLVIRGRKSFTE